MFQRLYVVLEILRLFGSRRFLLSFPSYAFTVGQP